MRGQQTSLGAPRELAELLPVRPFASDDPHCGLRILTRPHALRRRHLQFNAPFSLRWILHDIGQPPLCAQRRIGRRGIEG